MDDHGVFEQFLVQVVQRLCQVCRQLQHLRKRPDWGGERARVGEGHRVGAGENVCVCVLCVCVCVCVRVRVSECVCVRVSE